MITYGFVFRNYIQNGGGTYHGRPVAEVRNNNKGKRETDNKNTNKNNNKLLRKERRQECRIDRRDFIELFRLRIPDTKGWPYH